MYHIRILFRCIHLHTHAERQIYLKFSECVRVSGLGGEQDGRHESPRGRTSLVLLQGDASPVQLVI